MSEPTTGEIVLKPCPFCEGTAEMTETTLGGLFQAWCPHCSCIKLGSFWRTKELAANDWNKRIETDGK